MTARDDTVALAANISRYPWYLFFRDCHFWGPAFFLYFTSVLSLSEALRLEAVYYVGVAVLEVPSGYLSDRFGRKRTLVISSACLALAYLLFFTGHSFLQLVVAQVLLAMGFAFASGTDTAFHFESLKGLGREGEYAVREGRALRFGFRAAGFSALVGGLLAMGDLRWVYGASFFAALLSCGVAASMTEPEGMAGPSEPSMGRQVRRLLKKAWTPRLRFFTLYSLAMTVLVHIPYEFYQPYLERVASLWETNASFAPPVAGAHLAVTMLIGAWFTRYAGRLNHRCVVRRTLLSCTLLQGVLIGAMALAVHPVVALMLVGRTVSRAMSAPLINAELSPLLERHERSTYLSLQSLLGRLGYGSVLLMLPLGAGLFGDAFRGTLVCSLILACVFFGGLAVTPFPRDENHTCCRDHGRFTGSWH